MSRKIVTALALIGAAILLAVVVRPGKTQIRSTASSSALSLIPIAAPVKPERLDRWQVVGPGGGGSLYNAAVSPHDPNIVLVSCDMGGSYITLNGGTTWRQFNLPARARSFSFDPVDKNLLYAATGATGVWRSEDLGRNWEVSFPDASAHPRLSFSEDEADALIGTQRGFMGNVFAITVDPDDRNMIYAGVERSIYVSSDRGKTWKKLGDAIGAMTIAVDVSSPKNNRTLVVAGHNAIGVWENGAWKSGSLPPRLGWINDAAMGAPTEGGLPWVYVAGSGHMENGRSVGGVFLTKDGGQTWLPVYLGFKGLQYYPEHPAIAVNPRQPSQAYLSYAGLVTPTTGGAKFFGVAKTDDAGSNWALLRRATGDPDPTVQEGWLGSTYGSGWGESPLSLAIAPSNPNIVYSTDLGSVMRSSDGGRTWQAVYTQRVANNSYTTNGLDVTTSYGVHFDPFDPKQILISYTDIALSRSTDGGLSWSHSVTGIPRQWRNTIYWLVYDPAVRGKVWAVASGNHDLPRLRVINALKRGGARGGVIVSEDGGASWKASNQGMPESAVTHILLDPVSPADKRTLYVTAFGVGIYKSTDSGRSWILKNSGLPPNPRVWRMALGADSALYAVTVRSSDDGNYGNEGDGMLFRSRDGAETWERISLPAGLNGPVGVTPDVRAPGTLFVAAWGRSKRYDSHVTDGGVYLTNDDGAHWRPVLTADQHISDVTLDPSNPNVAYAAGFEYSAWRSVDRGQHWARIRGYNFKNAHRVIPDPRDPNMVFITTFGSSVWYGPAAGDPTSVEDIPAGRGIEAHP